MHTHKALAAVTVDMFDNTVGVLAPLLDEANPTTSEQHAASMLALRLSSPSLDELIRHKIDAALAGDEETPFPNVMPDDDDLYTIGFAVVEVDLENPRTEPTLVSDDWWYRDMVFGTMSHGGAAGLADLHQRVWEASSAAS